jgi:hypothetical protein
LPFSERKDTVIIPGAEQCALKKEKNSQQENAVLPATVIVLLPGTLGVAENPAYQEESFGTIGSNAPRKRLLR